jgi:hypothetical protein
MGGRQIYSVRALLAAFQMAKKLENNEDHHGAVNIF